jgi:hypothetical protein
LFPQDTDERLERVFVGLWEEPACLGSELVLHVRLAGAGPQTDLADEPPLLEIGQLGAHRVVGNAQLGHQLVDGSRTAAEQHKHPAAGGGEEVTLIFLGHVLILSRDEAPPRKGISQIYY